MATDPPRPPETTASPELGQTATADGLKMTRASAAWVATAAALMLLVLLIVFIMQNLPRVPVHYLGLTGSLPLGLALLIAAVGGGVLVGVVGGARVTQLRRRMRRTGR